jgi:hypothetical protein
MLPGSALVPLFVEQLVALLPMEGEQLLLFLYSPLGGQTPEYDPHILIGRVTQSLPLPYPDQMRFGSMR